MEKSLKEIFFSLDKFAYSIARWAYKIFLQLAEMNLSGDETSGKILRKIYVLIFFVMIFIISYSLLTYIVDPDKSSDSKTGTTSLVQKILISLGVIVASPFIFSELYYVQHLVLQSHLIENVILGGHSYSNKDSSVSDDEASINFMIASVYSSFLHPKDENISSWDCLQDDLNNENNSQNSNSSSNDSEDFSDSNVFKLYCIAYENVYETGDIEYFSPFVKNDNFSYMWLISFAAGIILAFFTLSFCVNLGVRAFKLLILEILAPVPALVELLPSKAGTLKKYFEEVLKVFAELFIYQAVILGTMWLLTLIPSLLADLFTGLSITRTWAYIILAFSFMRFAREVPQLLTDLFGLKSTGILRATGLRALNMAAFAGGQIGSTVGRFSRNFAATWRQSGGGVRGAFASLGSGLAGAGSGLARNAWRARNAQNLGDIRNARTSTNEDLVRRRIQRDVYNHSHGGTLGAMRGHIGDAAHGAMNRLHTYTGTQSDYDRNAEIEQVNTEMKDAYNTHIRDAIYARDGVWTRLRDLREEALANGGGDRNNANAFVEINGRHVRVAELEAQMRGREGQLRADHPDQVSRGLGYMQNIASAHQGVRGMSSIYHSINELYDNGNYNDQAWIDFEDEFRNGIFTGGHIPGQNEIGYDIALDEIRDNANYQQERIGREIEADRRRQTEQAANDAANNNNQNNH